MIERLTPRFVERPWGTTKLSPYFADSDKDIGEVWFTPGDAYPLLVKFIFTSRALSVQVHPDDDYARRYEDSSGKTEMWHILDVQPNSTIDVGFREHVKPDRLRSAIADGSIDGLLNRIAVAPGETYFIRAGVVHAIGAGLRLCEIQQNSNITYRLYDYGSDRELHIDKALDVLETGPYNGRRELPVACEHFITDEVVVSPGAHAQLQPDALLVILEGNGTIADYRFEPYEVWYVSSPAAISASQGARLLKVSRG